MASWAAPAFSDFTAGIDECERGAGGGGGGERAITFLGLMGVSSRSLDYLHGAAHRLPEGMQHERLCTSVPVHKALNI